MAAIATWAQYNQVVFKHLIPQSGLPVKNITAIIQDPQGFIWLGSNDGLFRYDGFSFKQYHALADSPDALPGDVISKLYIDRDGFLWVGTAREGLVKMTTSGKIIRILNSGTSPLFNSFSNRIMDVEEDNTGNLWFTTEDGLFQLLSGTDSLRLISNQQKRTHNALTNTYRNFCFDDNGRLWISSTKGVHIYDPLMDEFQHALHNPGNLAVLEYNRAIATLYYDKSKKAIWYSTWEPAVKRFDLTSNAGKVYFSGDKETKKDYGLMVQEFMQAGSGALWALTRNGAFLTDTLRENIEHHFVHQAEEPTSVISNYINGAIEDREGTTWLITDQGISTTRIGPNPFRNYVKTANGRYSFAGKEVQDVTIVDLNTLLVSTYAADGIYVTDSNFVTRDHLAFNDDRYDWIWATCRERFSGDVFLCTQGGVIQFAASDHVAKILRNEPFATNASFSSVVQTNGGLMWFSHFRNAFYRYDPRTGQSKQYRMVDLGEVDQIIYLQKAANDDIWIRANRTGILRFDPDQERITERFISGPDGLQQSEVMCIEEYGNKLLIGYETRGMSLYDKSNRSYRHFDKSDGLVSNSVHDMLMDHRGYIWITTANGLSRFDTTDITFLRFTAQDGMADIDLGSLNPLLHGAIAIGTPSGLIAFHPDRMTLTHDLEAPIVTELSVQGKQLRIDSVLTEQNHITISYNKNQFSIEYISPQYLNNHQVEYAYRLKGFDADWIFAGHRRYTNYSNLPAGEYVFCMRSRYPDGQWMESEFALPFVVHAAFFTRWWFFLLIGCLIVSGIFYLYRLKIQRIHAELQIRNKIARDLHDDIGSSLSGIKLISGIALQKVAQKDSDTAAMISGIVERSESMMDTMNDIVWSINPQHDQLGDVLVRMKEYAAEMLEPAGIEYQFVMDEKMLKTKLNLGIRKDIYLIFKEAINNMVRHAHCKSAMVTLKYHHNNFDMMVTDDGVGFIPEEMNARGNGLYNLQERAKQIQGKVHVTSTPGKGTQVWLRVPIA